MKIKNLGPILSVAIKTRKNILLKGKPGVGKSDILSQIAKANDFDLLICHAVISDPTDFKGLPVSAVLNGEPIAEFIPFGNLMKMIKARKKLLVLFDDLGQAPITVQAAIMQIILAREIDGQKISDEVSFVAATNSRADNAGVNGLITPLLSRFAAIIEVEADGDSWIEWALNNNMPAELIAFIKNKPNRISTFTASKEIENFACPRTIANLGNWINDGIIDLEVWSGCVGKEFAVEFKGFYDMFKKLGNLPAEIMRNPTNANVALEGSMMYFVLVALTNRVTDKATFETTMKYVTRVSLEFQAFYIELIGNKFPKARETASYIQWTSEHQHLLK